MEVAVVLSPTAFESMSLTWQHDAIELLRVIIGDIDTPPTYTDSQLARILVVSAYQLNAEVDFTQTYTIDLSEQLIDPDPTDRDGGTHDENFVNLMCWKAACLISRGSAIKAAGKAVSGSDMNAVKFDLTGVAESTLKLLEKGPCATYKELLNDYLYGDGIVGRAVMGPFRTYISGMYGGLPPHGGCRY